MQVHFALLIVAATCVGAQSLTVERHNGIIRILPANIDSQRAEGGHFPIDFSWIIYPSIDQTANLDKHWLVLHVETFPKLADGSVLEFRTASGTYKLPAMQWSQILGDMHYLFLNVLSSGEAVQITGQGKIIRAISTSESVSVFAVSPNGIKHAALTRVQLATFRAIIAKMDSLATR